MVQRLSNYNRRIDWTLRAIGMQFGIIVFQGNYKGAKGGIIKGHLSAGWLDGWSIVVE